MDTQPKPDRAAWLYGPSVKCSVPAPELTAPWRLVLLGAPGVGKGTQAQLLAQRFGACHLSTGDVFRAAKSRRVSEQTSAMAVALEAMRRGALVSDWIVSDMIRERIDCIACTGGFILDGFPRTMSQAKLLKQLTEQKNLALDAAINYELPHDEIIARLSGRRTCASCKAIFHILSKPPRVAGVCDECGARLNQRDDDRAESIKVRLQEHDAKTEPLISFYKEQGLLLTICSIGSPDEIHARTVHALNARRESALAPVAL